MVLYHILRFCQTNIEANFPHICKAFSSWLQWILFELRTPGTENVMESPGAPLTISCVRGGGPVAVISNLLTIISECYSSHNLWTTPMRSETGVLSLISVLKVDTLSSSETVLQTGQFVRSHIVLYDDTFHLLLYSHWCYYDKDCSLSISLFHRAFCITKFYLYQLMHLFQVTSK